jgi:purine-cytosine permease-like protein
MTGGRSKLLTIFLNFLPLIGYWTIIWTTMTFIEEFLFRRRSLGYMWSDYNNPKMLPMGIAAMTTFLIGWAGAIICMRRCIIQGRLLRWRREILVCLSQLL